MLLTVLGVVLQDLGSGIPLEIRESTEIPVLNLRSIMLFYLCKSPVCACQ